MNRYLVMIQSDSVLGFEPTEYTYGEQDIIIWQGHTYQYLETIEQDQDIYYYVQAQPIEEQTIKSKEVTT